VNSIPKTNINKLYDLNNQIFDYIKLTIYDLESKLDSKLSIKSLKLKLETFSDNHFKSSLDDFKNEIEKIKNEFPDIFKKINELSEELKTNYQSIIIGKFNQFDKIQEIRKSFQNYIDKISQY